MTELEMDDLFATIVAHLHPQKVEEQEMPEDTNLGPENFLKRAVEYECGCEFRWDHRNRLCTAFPCYEHLEQWQKAA